METPKYGCFSRLRFRAGHEFTEEVQMFRASKLSILITLCLFTLSIPLSGQKPDMPFRYDGACACRKARAGMEKIQHRSDSIASENIDVTSYTLNMDIDFDTETVTARCDVGLKSLENGLSQFTLDLRNLTVTGVKENGVTDVAFTHGGSDLTITPSSPMSLGEERVYAISYNGHPTRGFYFRPENGSISYTFNQPNNAKYWFPCRDVPSDKADWYRANITAPSDFVVASNGDLEEVVDNGDGTSTSKYFHDYPISTYLISIVITDFATFTQDLAGGPAIKHYAYPDDLEDAIYDWENTPAMIDFYATEYYPYPFPSYGMTMAPMGGAMEHQTISTMGSQLVNGNRSYEGVVAHELAHMWWGDLVTCNDWQNIWLNEGFATYFDALFTEHFYGEDAFRQQMIGNKNTYFGYEDYEGRFPLADPDYLWGGTVYNKGAWVLHMLRHQVGTATFKSIMNTYADQYQYGNVVTQDLIDVCESVSGMDLGWFFDQWVYMAGYPEYQYNWSHSGSAVTIEIHQIQEVDDVTPLFTMPVELLIKTPSGDVFEAFWVDEESETIVVPVPARPTQVIFDPYVWLLCSVIGTDGLVVAPGPAPDNPCLVKSFDLSYTPLGEDITPYGANRYGANVTAGNVAGGDAHEIITGPGPGPVFGPQVRGFDLSGTPVSWVNFFAYGTRKFGANVSAGDIDGDGYDEIISGAGPGAVFGPHVRAFNADGSGAISPVPGASFFAYGTRKWGVNVATGDIDGDGYPELLTGPGPGAVFGPHIRAFNYDGSGHVSPITAASFFAYGTRQYGANVGCGDMDGDGMAEFLTGPGPKSLFASHVRAFNFDAAAITPIADLSFIAYSRYDYGVQVGTSDLDGDGVDELMTAPGPDPEAPARFFVFRYADGDLRRIMNLGPFEGVTMGGRMSGGMFLIH
jgi:hypothetical protein